MILSRSQRINIMREVATRLGAEDYSLIDATLKQFGLPVRHEWSGTNQAYVLSMLEGADSPLLVELGQHVGFQLQAKAGGVDPPFWRNGMFRLFLSHLAAKKTIAAKLQEACIEFGISCFVAHSDIEPTQEWQIQIETALSTCDALVALLHPEFHDSRWADQEIGYAMGRGVPVYAIRFGQDPYGFIGRFQAFSASAKSPPQLARELFDAFRKNKETQARMTDVLVSLFESSTSFAESKERIGYLEEVATWDPAYSTRLRAAAKSNSQISGSWGVPDKIKALIRKWAP